MARRVFCFGNSLHGDDGVGPRIAEELRQLRLPKDIQVMELPHALELTRLLEGCVEAVLVDASCCENGFVGHVSVHGAEAVLQTGMNGRISHEADLRFALQSARAEWGSLPPIKVVTVTIAAIEVFKIGLSPAVEGAIPLAVAKIASLLRLGDH
ncbi:MAG: hydrogenase maturation protease [Candidatus Contendobacter sp.]|nr:hydrogenase maturation protease [Candidatus Contendobacter sp.]